MYSLRKYIYINIYTYNTYVKGLYDTPVTQELLEALNSPALKLSPRCPNIYKVLLIVTLWNLRIIGSTRSL